MRPRLISTRSVRLECQGRQIIAGACGLALTVLALVLGARGFYGFCGVVAVFAGGFFGAGLMALQIERWARKH